VKRVALATCGEVPGLDLDDRPLVPALAACGIEAAPAVWDDTAVDWTSFDLVVLRSTWDYAERHEEFLAWARSLRRVLNPLEVLEWNTDTRRYLLDLERAGVPVVPTEFVAPGDALEPPAGAFVVKPSISAGGRRSARFAPDELGAARELVSRIHGDGGTAMVQPYLGDVDEKALAYVDGSFSHALSRRVPLPSAGECAVLYLDEQLGPAAATGAERSTAEAALACAPGELLYGRVDLVDGAVLELEVTEPSLYLAFGEGAVDRFAAAIASRLG
jgi:glutathione synthase/RimK-type ligase-like ATP-grasp enzyme